MFFQRRAGLQCSLKQLFAKATGISCRLINWEPSEGAGASPTSQF